MENESTMKKKVLHEVPIEIGGLGKQALDELKRTIDKESQITIPDDYFMPNLGKRTTLTSGSVYKLTSPGFFFRLHNRHDWSPNASFKVLVSKNDSMSPAYLYLDTTGVGGNNHANNMYPIRPNGDTGCYFCPIMEDEDKLMVVCFVPAIGSTGMCSDTEKKFSGGWSPIKIVGDGSSDIPIIF